MDQTLAAVKAAFRNGSRAPVPHTQVRLLLTACLSLINQLPEDGAAPFFNGVVQGKHLGEIPTNVQVVERLNVMLNDRDGHFPEEFVGRIVDSIIKINNRGIARQHQIIPRQCLDEILRIRMT